MHANKLVTFLFPNTYGVSLSSAARVSRRPMEEVQAAVTAHLDQVSGLVEALSAELRRGMGPAADNLRAFVRAVDWTVFSAGSRRSGHQILTCFLSPLRS